MGNVAVKLANASIFIVTAPSGAGKTSLVSRLTAEDRNLTVCVSHTTRPMRPGDSDGRDYHFVSRPVFEQMIEDDLFLEHAEVFGNYYGSSIPAIESCTGQGKDVILEIDWQGAAQARQRLSGTVSVFILPPSREVLLRRLRGRGTDSEEVIARRSAEAVEEMRHYHEADYLLINDDFEQTLREFKAIILSQRAAMPRRKLANAELIASLID